MEAYYSFLRTIRHEAKATTGLSELCLQTLRTRKSTWISEADFHHNEVLFLDLSKRIYIWGKTLQKKDSRLFHSVINTLTQYTSSVLEQWYAFPWHKALSASKLVHLNIWLGQQHREIIQLYQQGFYEVQVAAQWNLPKNLTVKLEPSEKEILEQYWSSWFRARLTIAFKENINVYLALYRLEESTALLDQPSPTPSDNHLVYKIKQKVQRGLYPIIDQRKVQQVSQLFQRNEDINLQGLKTLFEKDNPFIYTILQDKKNWEKEQKELANQYANHTTTIRQFFRLKKEAFETFRSLVQSVPLKQTKGALSIGSICFENWFEDPQTKCFLDHIFTMLTENAGHRILNNNLTLWKRALQRIVSISNKYDNKVQAQLEDILHKDLDRLSSYTQNTVKRLCSSSNGAISASKKGISVQTYLEQHSRSVYSHGMIQKFQALALPVYITLSSRQRHTYILGKSGSGKTELLKYLIHQDIQAGNGVFVLDPHGDLAQECLRFKLFEQPTYKDRLVYISPEYMNQGFVPQYNPFDYVPTETTIFEQRNALSVRAKELSKSFESFFGNDFTPNMKLLLGNCIKLLLEAPHVHLGHLIDLLYPNGTGTDPYEDILATHHDSSLRQYFEHIFPAGRLDLAKTALITRLDEATSNQFFKHMLYAPKSSFNFRSLLDQGYIIIINASQAKLSRDGTHILGALLTAEMTIMALGRANQSASKRKPIFAYIDECQNFLNDGIDKLLAEGRKYGVHLLMANQFLGQFDGMSRLKQSIFANTAIKLCGSASVKDQTAMAKELKYTFDSNLQLGKGRFVCGIEGYKGILIQASNKLLPPLEKNPHYASEEKVKTILQEQLEQYYHQIDSYTGETKKTDPEDTHKSSSNDTFFPEIDDL
ncbi:MAG: helicase HerA domain-containing protein [Aureispira sp.]